MGPQAAVLLSALAAASALSHRRLNSTESKIEDLIPTALGMLPATVYGDPKNPLVLLAHGKVDLPDVYDFYGEHTKWEPYAKELAKEKYYVIVPNWNACHPRAECGLNGRGARNGERSSRTHQLLREQQFRDILKWAGKDRFAALGGHQWGGIVCAKYAYSNPNYVQQLILSAPAPKVMDDETLWMTGQKIGTPTLLLWTKDDQVEPYEHMSLVQKALKHSETFTIDEGGHGLHSQYLPVVMNFFKKIHGSPTILAQQNQTHSTTV